MKEGRTVPRRGKIAKRDVLPDPMYGSKLVTKLINNVMEDGKKGVAQKIVYEAFSIVEEKAGQNALEAFQAAFENVMPVPLTRFLWKSEQSVVRLSVFAGSFSQPESAPSAPWQKDSPTR